MNRGSLQAYTLYTSPDLNAQDLKMAMRAQNISGTFEKWGTCLNSAKELRVWPSVAGLQCQTFNDYTCSQCELNVHFCIQLYNT